MRLYIKGDYTKEIPFDYIELAKRMWFDTKDGLKVIKEKVSLSPILVFFKSEIGMI